MTVEETPSVFILGSCVSRDALDAAPGRFQLAEYLARTSMASIGMPEVKDEQVRAKVSELASSFQRRMLLNDMDKKTLSAIASVPHDILLVDFIDERFKLVCSDASIFSYSGELEKGGLGLEGHAIIEPGSDAFMTLWLAGMQRFLAQVDTSKVVLNRAYWAERFPDGSDASSMGWIRRNNAFLQQLYDAVDRHWQLKTIEYQPELVIADPQHRWGPAPYHYTQAFYEHTIRSLSESMH